MKYPRKCARLMKVVAIATLAFSSTATTGVLAADDSFFMRKCGTCHTYNYGGRNSLGPNLFGVYGHAAGSVAGFRYSEGFVSAKNNIGVWDDQKLNEYLSHPSAFIRAYGGNKSRMNFKLTDEQDRRAVIDYLKVIR